MNGNACGKSVSGRAILLFFVKDETESLSKFPTFSQKFVPNNRQPAANCSIQ